MYLYCYRKTPNFGDVLNFWLWKKHFRNEFSDDRDDHEYFVGIGTLLNKRLPQDKILHIFGSGAGYGDLPILNPELTHVHFVRGPRTAQALGLPRDSSITDPAALLHLHADLGTRKSYGFSFMPHHSIESERLRDVVESVGIRYISPTQDHESIIEDILKSDKILCSAMHGAIVADALRVPWLPVVTHSEIFEFKWHDWSESMNTPLRFHHISPLYPKRGTGLIKGLRGALKERMVGQELRSLMKKDFSLSSDSVLKDRLDMLQTKIDEFNTRP